MVTRKELLKNLRNYSPIEIADAIKAGIVSMYDLSKETEGAFTPLLKRQVKAVLDAQIQQNAVGEISPSNEHITSEKEFNTITTIQPIPIEESNISVVSYTAPSPMIDYAIDKPINVETYQVSSEILNGKQLMFSRVFSFKGRIRRLEYGLTYLAYYLWCLPMRVMSVDQIPEAYAIIFLLTILPFLWILFAQGAKRCHDRGNSGWYQMIPFYILWMIFAQGDSDSNKYGNNPK